MTIEELLSRARALRIAEEPAALDTALLRAQLALQQDDRPGALALVRAALGAANGELDLADLERRDLWADKVSRLNEALAALEGA